MNDGEKFIATDLMPAFIVGQWVSVVEDLTNIIVYVLVSVLTKVILNILEKNDLRDNKNRSDRGSK